MIEERFGRRRTTRQHLAAPSTSKSHRSPAALGSVARPDERARRPAPELGHRIIRIIEHEPFENVVATLGFVLVCALLNGAGNPLEAFDGLCVRLREAVEVGLDDPLDPFDGAH